MGRFSTWALVVSMGLTVVTGCSAETPGQALPVQTTPTSPGSSSTDPPSSTAGDDESLDGVDPCTLFTETTKTRLGITGEGSTYEAPSSVSCKWKVRKEISSEGYTIGVIVFPELGLDDVIADGEKTPVQVGTRRAIQSIRGQGGACAISVEVTTTSRIDIQTVGGIKGAAALCPRALDAARLVEPELP